ncbi:helix-turn-helix domain-containing protein [Escherichia coli]|uniref:helix-turn-helix domain-containing protein n=1 Tax=Escherichia coli TaxID=562 RepID=UPI001FCE3863|nr:helix-turn-helix domain-containing protein [Escherichia coli]
MTCEAYFIVYLDKKNLIKLSNNITLFSQSEERLFFVRGRLNDVLLCNNSGHHIITISRELLCQFIWLLEVDIFKAHISENVPAYITQPCPKGTVSREIVRELCADNLVISAKRKQFLLMTLISSFLENKAFLPLLKQILRKRMKEQVITIITRDISENWNIAKVATKLYISPSLLKKKLKDENTSYSRIVLECRMQKAQELLSLLHLPVKQTAYLCGYRSVPYFIAVFKRYYSCTPYEYGIIKRNKQE